jgi:fructose PTS system EIIBC or EIIC component
VIPSLMLGSAVTGALVMGFANTSRAPHGGIWVVGLIGKPLLYILAILIGTAVTAAAVIVLKMAGRKEAADIEPAASRQATATG